MKYLKLVDIYEELDSTTKRLEKTFYLKEFFNTIPESDIDYVVLLLEGKVFPDYSSQKIGVSSQIVSKAIHVATGLKDVEEKWKEIGDLGKVAEQFVKTKKQETLFSKELTVKKVFDNIKKLSTLTGSGSTDQKVQLIAELLTSATPKEARYIVRTVLEDLRIGIKIGVIRDALVWFVIEKETNFKFTKETSETDLTEEEKKTFDEYTELVQEAIDMMNDFSEVFNIIRTKGAQGLRMIKINVGKPIKVMLFPKVKDVKEAFETVGSPAAFEYKYDGFRLEIHRNKEHITLFTRRLEDVTEQFPEVVEYIKKYVKGDNYILDSEAIGYDKKSGRYVPFQNISQRIRRKYDISKMVSELPVEVNVFDVLYYDSESMIKKPFIERRKLIEKIITSTPKKIQVAKQLITDNVQKAEKFYHEALSDGEEGVMIKKLDAVYKPGARVGYGVKLKPIMETLDLVIVRAEYGTGKRATWLSSFTLACKKDDQFLEIGKVGTGFKEGKEEGLSFEELTELLKPIIISTKGRDVVVKPKIVIEVSFEEIQESPTYGSGFALRFPRVVRLRDDKSADDVSSLEQVKRLFREQK